MPRRSPITTAAGVAAGLALVVTSSATVLAEPEPDASFDAQDTGATSSDTSSPAESDIDAGEAAGEWTTAADAQSAGDQEWPWEEVESETGLWVVEFESAAAGELQGELLAEASLSASAVEAEVEAYATDLVAEQDQGLASVEATLARDVEPEYSYQHALNGVALELSAAEAEELWDLPEVSFVWPDQVYELQTDVSHDIISSPTVWEGETGTDLNTRGEGIIVAMIDSGVNPDHPSFAEEDGEGYVHTNPYGAGNYVGNCDPDSSNYEDICNDKLIGAYNFFNTAATARDQDDHGSHVGSTIAGNVHDATFTFGATDHTRTVQGVAPRANVISYLVCSPGCPGAASVAATNQAIQDDVDVLNYSISGGDSPWNDGVDRAFLTAHNAGISIFASAGNAGPGPQTVAKTGPWNSTVASTTTERIFSQNISTADGSLVDLPSFPGPIVHLEEDLEAEAITAASVDPGNVLGCNAFPEGAFEDAIAIIDRGTCAFMDKTNNAAAAGALAVIFVNNAAGPPTSPASVGTTIPSMQLHVDAGTELAAWADDADDATILIEAESTLVEVDEWRDTVSSFSSRGPSQFDLLAPTFGAPGQNILAAGSAQDGVDERYIVISGTSMSSPHGAGAGALLRALYPDLSPTEIRSVLASTADFEGIMKEDEVTQADPLDIGSGRINLDNASRAGLALDETGENFEAANPAQGGDPATLNLPAFVNQDCPGACGWERTVTNITDVPVTYTATVENPAAATVTVSPETITLEPGESADLTVQATVESIDEAWSFGQVLLSTDATHANGTDVADAHFPIAVIGSEAVPGIDVDPTSFEVNHEEATTTTETLTISNTGAGELEWSIDTGEGSTGTTVTHSASNTITPVNSAACGNSALGTTSENRYLRHFDLEALGYTDGFSVNEVTFGIENNTGGDYDVEVNLHTLIDPDGAFVTSNFELVESVDYTVAAGAADELVNLPLEAELEAGSVAVLEVHAPARTEGSFYIGSNGSGQTAPSYLIGPECGITQPTDTAEIGFADMHLVMSLNGEGEQAGCELPEWLSVNPTEGTIGPLGSTDVEVTFDSTGLEDGEYTSQLCLTSNDPNTPSVTVPVTFIVGYIASPPSVEVDPEAIDVEQGQGTVEEYDLTISNVVTAEDEDLVWEFTPWGGEGETIVDKPVDGTSGIVSDYYVDDSAGVFSAENFEVTEATAVGSIYTPGFWVGDDVTERATEITWEIYADADGSPAGYPGDGEDSFVWSHTAAVDGAGVQIEDNEITLDLVAATGAGAELEAGDYWVTVFPSITGHINLNDRWNWYQSTDTDQPAQLIDPDDLFGLGALEWEGLDGLVGWNNVAVTIESLDTCTADWVSVTPAEGTTPGAESSTVAVAIDTAGLEPGEHTTELCLVTNDPENPQVTITVTVTVEEGEPVDPPAIVVDPESLSATAEVGDTATGELLISNEGGSDLEFQLTNMNPDEPIDWLNWTPEDGVIAAGEDATIDLTYDAAELEAGVYEGMLTVVSNDPENGTVDLDVTFTVTDEAPTELIIDRVEGTNRYATAARVSSENYPDGSDVVYVATGLNYADALSAAALAGSQEAPLLLVPENGLPWQVALELRRLGPDEVVVLGGSTVVSDEIAADVAEAAGVDEARRISGTNRYRTSAAVAAEFETADVVFVATGRNFPDALSAAAAAGYESAPLVLSNTNAIAVEALEEIERLDPDEIIIVGGTSAVSDDVAELLGDYAEVDRLVGGNRWATNAAVLERYDGLGDNDTVYLATGADWPDALVGAALAGAHDTPLALTNTSRLHDSVATEIERLSPSRILIFGGDAVVTEAVEEALRALDIP